MDAQTVIRTIHDIYDRFNVPPHIRIHMIRSAAVADMICAHWQGPAIHEDDIIAVCLLHDLGNIVKIRFDDPLSHLFFFDKENIAHWKRVQQDVKRAYGTDAEEVTHAMVRELCVRDRFMYLLIHKEWAHFDEVVLKDDLDLKIITYADNRVGPFGVVSFMDRIAEIVKRYGEDHIRNRHPDFEQIIVHAKELEQQVLQHTDMTPADITDSAIQSFVDRLSR